MKQLLLVFLFIGTVTFSQSEPNSIIEQAESIDKLAELTGTKDVLIHYFKEAVEASKDGIKSTMEIAEAGVLTLVEQSTIVVKQYIIFTSIQHAIPLIIAIFLMWYFPSRIEYLFTTNASKALEHNNKIDAENAEFKKAKKYLYTKGKYYSGKIAMIASKVIKLTPFILGAYIFSLHLMIWIKVTFFSKLYLVELLTKYI